MKDNEASLPVIVLVRFVPFATTQPKHIKVNPTITTEYLITGMLMETHLGDWSLVRLFRVYNWKRKFFLSESPIGDQTLAGDILIVTNTFDTSELDAALEIRELTPFEKAVWEIEHGK